MCGETEDWQEAHDASVRITGSGANSIIHLARIYDDVEEVRLNEVLVTGFNGGTSGAFYLQVSHNGLNPSVINNENNKGVLIPVDVLNPHSIYQRPRTIMKGDQVNLQQFELGCVMPDNSVATFTEAVFVFTIVVRKSPDQIAEVRRLKASVDYLPSIKADARNQWNP